MSHHGTNWAIIQRGLKPTTRIVLWHLCDRHNPDYGCFPTQARLAHDCEISRSTLNLHLIRLESAGLLRRMTRINPVSKRQMSTRYFLGFEDDYPTKSGGKTPDPEPQYAEKPCLVSGHGAVSDLEPEPCPKNSDYRVLNSDTNPVREPLREPVKEKEERAGARDGFFEEFFGELLKALGFDPKGVLPAWWQGQSAKANVRRWGDDLGLDEGQILEVAAETRGKHPTPPDGPRALDRAMERAAVRHRSPPDGVSGSKRYRGRGRTQTDSRASLERQLEFYSGMVNFDKYLPQNMISSGMCDAMLAHGLVTPERLQMRGVL
ncbi:hypothetical protein A9Q96_16915 [Rhodobacterales bacterium 52_120_T64]|nr:hypothetical protein A9Q96_16915 [Rhodobacterales bacterium 52_120_T64]